MRISTVVILLFFVAALRDAGAAGSYWETDYEYVYFEAAGSDRAILLYFTGSDWCLWCRKLDNELFADDAFTDGIGELAAPVALDFPQRKRLPPKHARANRLLKRQWKVEAFPTIILFDPLSNRELWRHGYVSTSGDDYLKAVQTSIDERKR